MAEAVMGRVEVRVNPEVTADQLWEFYCANDICADFEQRFFESVGFAENVGHKVYYVEERPYVLGSASEDRQ